MAEKIMHPIRRIVSSIICFLFLLTGKMQETGRQLAQFTINTTADPKSKPTVMLQLPLGLSLRKGVVVKIDKGDGQTLDLQTCEVSGCYAGSVLSDEMLSAMRSGAELKIGIQNLKHNEINLGFSLVGFSAAFDRIKP